MVTHGSHWGCFAWTVCAAGPHADRHGSSRKQGVGSWFRSTSMAPHSTPVLLPGNSHGQRSLVGCSPWGCKESDATERLHFHFSLSCIGEGNGNALQCSCLENPRDGGAWWAAISGVAQCWTRLKRLSSSSSSLTLQVPTTVMSGDSGTVATNFPLWLVVPKLRKDMWLLTQITNLDP